MAGPGFHGDYSVMKIAGMKIGDARDSLSGPLANFRDRASLDGAIPSVSGDKFPIPAAGLMGPDIDQMETLLAQSVRVYYQVAVDAVDGFLGEASKQLDVLSQDVFESIREYRRRDEEGESGLPNMDHPR
ncbi:hypothetical protein [Saccharopolyspora cebuensis]|uniref:Excreted virulence factor EspC, type VII ESX diderm n=2 Tax=Saccharopolyspora cebuensis TaxID=418759 RepID=A0ABV4CHP6_9PSEU